MTTLVLGATGATGRLLLEQLLKQGEDLRIIVRSSATLPDTLKNEQRLSITEANILDMSDADLLQHVQGCRAVVSCLGHSLNLQGLFGHPRRLVTDATRRICGAIETLKAQATTKFILMNSTGCQNKLAGETVSLAQAAIVTLLRYLLPPHADNENAVAYLASSHSHPNHFKVNNAGLEWVAVRPDALIDENRVSPYNTHPSPIRSAIFDSGKTSRINVAHFISQLIIDEELWRQWKYQRPVLYNCEWG
jgi:nucleoside-diphosphate-sugar epimerase